MASRSQTVILKRGRGQNVKFLPYAFTEHGAIQAANVLSSPHLRTIRELMNPPAARQRPIGFVELEERKKNEASGDP